jgi:hypothetical protein
MKDIFFGAAVVCFFAGFSVSSFRLSRNAQRRAYWVCACLAGVSGFLMCYPNWEKGLGVAGLFFGAMAIAAYVTTPYIKIGGKVYALTVSDSQPDPEEAPTPSGGHASAKGVLAADSGDPEFDPAPDSYSAILSAAKMWWMLVIVAVIAAGNMYFVVVGRAGGLIPVIMAAFITLLAIGVGYADGSWNYAVARRQHFQFGVVSLITAGSFAVVYLAAYFTARLRPLRRAQSMEYRVHPRHSKRSAAD